MNWNEKLIKRIVIDDAMMWKRGMAEPEPVPYWVSNSIIKHKQIDFIIGKLLPPGLQSHSKLGFVDICENMLTNHLIVLEFNFVKIDNDGRHYHKTDSFRYHTISHTIGYGEMGIDPKLETFIRSIAELILKEQRGILRTRKFGI